MKFASIEPALCSETLCAVKSFGFKQMTPVQASTIPLFLKNKDVCVDATTGSGKTLAFGIPIVEMLVKREKERKWKKHEVGALVIAPTRELAKQIYEVMMQILASFPRKSTKGKRVEIALERDGTTQAPQTASRFSCAAFVGGVMIQEHIQAFEANGGNITVCTPGRMVDLVTKCDLIRRHLKSLEVLILDEADTLLAMGFRESINSILAVLPKQRRTGLFSATQTSEVQDLVRAGLRNAVQVAVRISRGDSGSSKQEQRTQGEQHQQQVTPSTLQNYYSHAGHDRRPAELATFLLHHTAEKVIIFCATCACVDYYSYAFREISKIPGSALQGIGKVFGLHGRQTPKRRNGVYESFLADSTAVLFCTDVAARGIDIPDVQVIVQMAAPRDPAFFIHRVGRVARAGKKGTALLMISEHEDAYIDFLRGRGVPLSKLDSAAHECFGLQSDEGGRGQDAGNAKEGRGDDSDDDGGDDAGEDHVESDDVSDLSSMDAVAAPNESPPPTRSFSSPPGQYDEMTSYHHLKLYTDRLLEAFKALNSRDRTALEMGSTAFMAFLRSYKEHHCSYIFRYSDLDLGSVARGYGLLRLPKIPETRVGTARNKYTTKKKDGEGGIGGVIAFEQTYVDTTAIPYKHKEKEQSRKAKLKLLKEAQKEQEALLQQEEEEGGGLEIDGGSGSDEGVRTVKSRRSVARSILTTGTGATMATKFTVASNGTVLREKKAWVPVEHYEKVEDKRQRKKKKSYSKRTADEWDELAAEEAAYKKYKKGKITKEEYEELCLLHEEEDGYDHDKIELEGVKTLHGDDRAIFGIGQKKRKGGMSKEEEEELREMENDMKRQYYKQRGAGKNSGSSVVMGASSRRGAIAMSSGGSVKSLGTIARKDYRKRKKGGIKKY